MKHKGRLRFKTMKSSQLVLEFYFVCNWSVKKPLTGRKAVSPHQTSMQFCYLTLGAGQANQKVSQTEPSCSAESSIHPGYLGRIIFEHHVITVDLNGNGVFLLYPHPVWNVGLS